MNIGYFNARGINDIEHWYKLEIEELERRGHNVRIFTLNPEYGNHPTRDDIKWMDFAHYHFAQVANRFKRLGVPFGISPHANDIFIDNGRNLLSASNHPKCKFVTYQSFYHKKKFEEWGVNRPLVYLPMCCRTKLFTRQTPYNPSGGLVAGGRLIPKKGLDRLKGVENLTIFGDGPLEEYLKCTLKHMSFTGHLSGEELKDLFEKSRIYLFPAIVTPDGDSDGIPNTIKEAMLMKLHVIASPVAGIPELENITLLSDWSKINEVLETIPKTANWKGEREIRNIYDPKVTINMLLKAIEEYL